MFNEKRSVTARVVETIGNEKGKQLIVSSARILTKVRDCFSKLTCMGRVLRMNKP